MARLRSYSDSSRQTSFRKRAAPAVKIDSHMLLRRVGLGMALCALWIVVRLIVLQIFQHETLALKAESNHEVSQKIHPTRGIISFQDSINPSTTYPAAISRTYYDVFAVPASIPSEEIASTSMRLAEIMGFSTDTQRLTMLKDKLSKHTSYYQVLERKIPVTMYEELTRAQLRGIYTTPRDYRFYPEKKLAAAVLGFCSQEQDGALTGRYGVEGYWNRDLTGRLGFVSGEKSAGGNWITLAGRTMIPVEQGQNIVLTIDRTLQYEACRRLEAGMGEYGATNASLVMLDPKTGSILAMCSFPDFDPNEYNKVSSTAFFNNSAIFTAYEPGSVFKPITMAAALDLGLVSPTTTFVDPCKRVFGPFTIYNALRKCYETVTMTQVLQNSINTGVVWLSEKIGPERFKTYVDKFGFGQKTGIGLGVEVAGVLPTLAAKYTANAAYASFGQSLTATPLQLAVAYGAIANKGVLMKPMIVKERYSATGELISVEQPHMVDRIMSERASKVLTGMLVATLDNYKKTARLEHYFVAGKTGTAQIATRGGYLIDGPTNHTLAGFGPSDDPRVVLVVKYGEILSSSSYRWAESTTGPVFKDIMKFVFDYYHIPSQR